MGKAATWHRLDESIEGVGMIRVIRWVVLLCWVWMCFGGEARADLGSLPKVLVTLKPIHSLVSSLMEGRGSPDLLWDRNTSPHTFVFQPKDLVRLKEADCIIWIGPCLETGLRGAVSKLNPQHVLTLQETSSLKWLPLRNNLRQTPDAGVDGHIWLDPLRMQQIAKIMAKRLMELDPSFKAGYQKNLKRLQKQLLTLHEELKAGFQPFQDKPFIVFHDAYHYLEERYGLKATHVVFASPEASLRPKDFETVLQALRQSPETCVFFEPQFRAHRLQIFLSRRQNVVPMGTLDPLGTRFAPGPEFYPTLMRQLIRDFDACFRKVSLPY